LLNISPKATYSCNNIHFDHLAFSSVLSPEESNSGAAEIAALHLTNQPRLAKVSPELEKN